MVIVTGPDLLIFFEQDDSRGPNDELARLSQDFIVPWFDQKQSGPG